MNQFYYTLLYGIIGTMTAALFLVIIILASLFRITNLDLIEFKADEAINVFLATRPLFGHPFPPGSTVSSLGILNPPLFNYILLPLTMISTDPKFLSFFIGLSNSLAIGGLFLLLKRYYGLTLALIAATLFAISPWSILFSRKIWAQDLLLPLLIILLFSIHKILLEKKLFYWITFTLSSLLLLQLHQSTLFFLFPLIVFLLIQKPKFNFRFALIGFFIGILPLLPYVSYQLANNCPDCTRFFTAGEQLVQRKPDHFLRPFQIMGQGNFFFVLGNDVIAYAQQYPLVYNLRRFFYIEYILLPLGMILFWRNFPKLRLFLYITITLPLVYFLLRIEPLMHYYLVLTPFLFLFLASAFSFLFHKHILLKLLASLLVTMLIGLSLAFNLTFLHLLAKQKGISGDYGPAFTTTEAKHRELLARYQKDDAYHEMLIASYVPKNLFYGFLPLANMLYNKAETEKNLPRLEERLKAVPEDPRVQLELLAFYSNPSPTRETLALLKKKAQALSAYQVVYQDMYESYQFDLTKRLKRLYMTSLGFSFEYPGHWIIEKTDDLLTIKGDNYLIFMKKLKTDGKTASLSTDTFYKTIALGKNNIVSISYNSGSQEDLKIRKNIEEITASLREE